MTTSTLERLEVMPDWQFKGRHHYHDSRFIVTAGTETEDAYCGDMGHPSILGGSPFEVTKGRIIARMTDCEDQAQYATLLASAPELLEALQQFAQCSAVRDIVQGDTELACAVFAARAAISKATGQP